MNTISTATLSQPLANATALNQIASTMFAMDAILTRKQRQLKMPRPDAYGRTGSSLEPSARANALRRW